LSRKATFGLIMTLGAWATLLAEPACADVMEVGSDGHHWVAGGPAAADSVSPQSVSLDGSANLAVTQVASSAGPAAWRDRLGELAAKYDLSPSLLEALIWQESRWHPEAVSPVGARGLAQLMPGTARQLGVDAADPHSNMEGGARYLRMQLDAFGGDLEKALAAYNAGPGPRRQGGRRPCHP